MNPVRIHREDARWAGLGATVMRAALQAFVARPLVALPHPPVVDIVLTDDAQVRQLNREYRHKDSPTNVLSFPDGSMQGKRLHLGDVFLAYDTLMAEADAQKKRLKHHLTHLTLHGVLHLMGYDHENEKDAKLMEKLEIRLLFQMGIANPYS